MAESTHRERDPLMSARQPHFSAVLSRLLALTLIAASGCAPLAEGVKEQKARDQWLQKARDGDPEAQYQMAKSYCCGIGPIYNTRLSIEWYCRAAKQGYVPAQLALANMFSDNLDDPDGQRTYLGKPPVDFVSAYVWYTVAAEQGNPTAVQRQNELGNMMAPQDIDRASEIVPYWRYTGDCSYSQ